MTAATSGAAAGTARHELVNVGLVSWYLFGAKDIELRGRIALVGANGAGKSSILDAIKTVLLARHGGHLNLNSLVQVDRGGDRSARRSVRDYCLGALDDADDGMSFQREHAVSYLLLGFRHTRTQRETTLGLALSASQEAGEANVEARFLVEGAILRAEPDAGRGVREGPFARVGDDEGGEWVEAKPWHEARAWIQRRHPEADLRLEAGADLFLRAICTSLGPEHGVMDHRKFVRNLKNSTDFKPVGNTTDFVRNFILDPQPLNLRELRASISRYRAVREKISELKGRIEEAARLRAAATAVVKRSRTLARQGLDRSRGLIHKAASALEQARRDRSVTSSHLATAETSLPALTAREAEAGAEMLEAVAAEAASPKALAIKERQAALRILDGETDLLSKRLASASRVLRTARSRADLVASVDRGVGTRLAALPDPAAASAAETARALERLASRSSISDLERVLGVVERRASDLQRIVYDREGELTALRTNAERVGSGRSPLGLGTLKLMDLLAAEGIEARPLCELVTEVDEEWRAAAEAVLGEAREALIVSPDRYGDAIAAYRRADRHFGGSVVNTTRTSDTRPPRRGSLATAIRTSDPHARAFVDFRLGGVAMARDDVSLAAADSGIARSLMYSSGRATRKLRPVETELLGISPRDAASGLAHEIDASEALLAAERVRLAGARDALGGVSALLGDVRAIDVIEVGDIRDCSEAAARRGIAIQDEIVALESDDDEAAERRSRAEAELARIRLAREDASRLVERLSERLASQAEVERRLEGENRVLREKAREALDADRPLLQRDEAEAASRWLDEPIPDPPDARGSVDADPEAEEAVGKVEDGEDLERLLRRLERHIDYNRNRVEKDRANLGVRIGDYVNRRAVPRPGFLDDAATPTEGFLAAVAWVELEVETLQGKILKDYESEAEAAHRDAVTHFKEDFAGKMRGAFQAQAQRLRELNRQLAKRDFHGLTYRFGSREANAYKDMIALVEASGENGFDLSGEGAVPYGDRVVKAVRRLEEIALDPEADIADLEDPRRYFDFDLAMEKDGVERTTMSKRLATGSGGQVQVPYYVAICAALAATYYPGRADDGGCALAMFDEAFNRMDTAVISEVLGFMSDLGLQPFIAAPDKERGTFIQFVDTMIDLSRVGTSVQATVTHVKPYAHERFRRENPTLIGFDRFDARGDGDGRTAAE